MSERDLGNMCLNEKLVRFIRAMFSSERIDTPSLTSLSCVSKLWSDKEAFSDDLIENKLLVSVTVTSSIWIFLTLISAFGSLFYKNINDETYYEGKV